MSDCAEQPELEMQKRPRKRHNDFQVAIPWDELYVDGTHFRSK